MYLFLIHILDVIEQGDETFHCLDSNLFVRVLEVLNKEVVEVGIERLQWIPWVIENEGEEK